ncbi:MAG TPA: hypothetical protein VFX17_03910 [Patescibacteria group bacterium]|nr:hypothetical protein [Patescibacteria group bacterium]
MNTHQNKILSNFIITVVLFLGLETLSVLIGLNQIWEFLSVAWYLFAFQVIWIAFMFDLHLKDSRPVSLASVQFRHILRDAFVQRLRHFGNFQYLRHFANYYVLPTILFWSAAALLFLNPFRPELKQVVILISAFAFCLNFAHMHEHLSRKLSANSAWLRILSVAKLLVAYEAYAGIIGICWYFAYPTKVVFWLTVAVTFFLMHQALFAHGFQKSRVYLFAIIFALFSGLIGVWAFHNWTYQYLTAALILLALYNTVWGFMHHYLEKTFTSKIALEYLVLGLLVVSIILATHNFAAQVI